MPQSHHTIMGGIPSVNPPVPLAPGKWIAKIILAVILGEAIWGLLVSLTNGLIVPGLARVMGGDPSPVYLGNGAFQLTPIFISVLELCLAGIVAILLNQWSSGSAGTRVRTVRIRTVTAKGSMPSIAPAAPRVPSPPAASEPSPMVPAAAVAAPGEAPSGRALTPPAAPFATKPSAPAPTDKAKQPHETYYNLVGEPINPTEDDQ